MLQGRLHAVRAEAYPTTPMTLAATSLRTAEFLAVDTETNGLNGPGCELTEVGAVLVGGGELHDRYESLVRVRRPLSRGIQRFTGISQQMVDEAPESRAVLERLAGLLEDRVLVAHNASFDRRVLRAAFEREGVLWPDPPVLCTVALARRFAPLVRRRGLASLAASLGIDVEVSHRALPDAETCARVFCALFGRLCANALTVDAAVALLRPARRSRKRPQTIPALDGTQPVALPAGVPLDFGALPSTPGVYLFRDGLGRVLYVGKSVDVRSRARAHFRAGAARPSWAPHAASVDARSTRSELGALLLERRLIGELRPPGNKLLKGDDPRVWIRCRFDIAFPVLEVARAPASGLGVSVGPLRGRATAVELVEQLTSLFGLRHCGRKLPRRDHPSAYGQMGRCISPCLGDLDPNLYRARLDEALALFTGPGDGRERVLAHVDAQMRAASKQQLYERAAWLRRRRARLETLLERLGGALRASHARSRLVLAGHPATSPPFDAFWLVGGRVVDWGPLPDADALERRTIGALRHGPGVRPGSVIPVEAAEDIGVAEDWLAAHPDARVLELSGPPARDALWAFAYSEGPTAISYSNQTLRSAPMRS
jgi:DNA polymerase-3 subunit epsilon